MYPKLILNNITLEIENFTKKKIGKKSIHMPPELGCHTKPKPKQLRQRCTLQSKQMRTSVSQPLQLLNRNVMDNKRKRAEMKITYLNPSQVGQTHGFINTGS